MATASAASVHCHCLFLYLCSCCQLSVSVHCAQLTINGRYRMQAIRCSPLIDSSLRRGNTTDKRRLLDAQNAHPKHRTSVKVFTFQQDYKFNFNQPTFVCMFSDELFTASNAECINILEFFLFHSHSANLKTARPHCLHYTVCFHSITTLLYFFCKGQLLTIAANWQLLLLACSTAAVALLCHGGSI